MGRSLSIPYQIRKCKIPEKGIKFREISLMRLRLMLKCTVT